MNYEIVEKSKEETNYAHIIGKVCQGMTKSHSVEGESFFEFKVEVERLSKIKDIIPITVSERSLLGKTFNVGDKVDIVGEYRSYNKLLGEKSKLVLHLFAKEISISDSPSDANEVKLIGFICKEHIYRKTPFDREICDILLAVNRQNYHKSDYVPCILWGRNARFISNQPVGCKVEIFGRIQSREYVKELEGKEETFTAYEVSCQRISLLSNLTNLDVKFEQNSANDSIG